MATEIASLYARIGIDSKDAERGLSWFRSSLQSAGAAAMKMGAALGVGGLATTAVLLGKQMVKTSADFESQMNIMTLAARSSGTSMEDLSRAALAVGGDTRLVGINAAQTAEAMTAFYKAGLSTTEIMGDYNQYLTEGTELTGALRAAIDLAAASELDLAATSDIVAIAMATFGLDASEASRITDSFVQTADASVTSVGELAEALANVGPTVAQFGWTLEDTNTALAILSERGIRGAEAGTALKSMMTNLMRQTPDVVSTLKALNITLYDEAGAMRTLPDIIGQLSGAMGGLSEEQRNNAIETLAGTYGMKAMSTLLAEGTGGWEEMAKAIAGAATAQESAAARTKGFNAETEKLTSAWQTFIIDVGTPFLEKVATPFVTGITDIVEALDNFATSKAGTFFGDLAVVLKYAADNAKLFVDNMNLPIQQRTGLLDSLMADIKSAIELKADALRRDQEQQAAAVAAMGPYQTALEYTQQKILNLTATYGPLTAAELTHWTQMGYITDATASHAAALDTAAVATETTAERIAAAMENASPRLQAQWAQMRADLAGYQQGVAADAAVLQSGMWIEVAKVSNEGQAKLLEMQAKWGAETLTIQDAALQALLSATDAKTVEELTRAQDHAAKLAEIDASFKAQMETAQAAIDTKELASLAEKYAERVANTESAYAQEGAVAERARLIDQIEQSRSHILELTGLRQFYMDKIGMMLAQAYAEQDLTDEQIKARLTAMGIALSAEAQLAVEHSKLNEEKLKSDQAYAQDFVNTLGSMVDAEIAIQTSSLADAKRKLEAWTPPAITLPQIGTGLGQINTDLGNQLSKFTGGVGDAVNKKTVTVVEAVEDTANKMADAITSAIDALVAVADYKGSKDLAKKLGNLITDIRAAMDAFATLPNLGTETDTLTPSLGIWAERMQAVASLLDSATKVAETLTERSTGFRKMAALGLEGIRDAILRNVIPVIRGIHAAFKQLPKLLPEEEISASLDIWNKRMGAISGIVTAVVGAVKTLIDKPSEMKGKSLEAVRDAVLKNIIPVVRGIHAAFKQLPKLLPEEEISASLDVWNKRMSAIAGIIGSVVGAVDDLMNKNPAFKTAGPKGVEAIRDAILRNVIPVIRGIHAAFKELPKLLPEEEISTSLDIWNKRMGAISGILGSAFSAVDLLVNKPKAVRGAAAKGITTIRDAILRNVIPVVRGIHAAFKELPRLVPAEEISASMAIWDTRYKAISGILTSFMTSVRLLVDQPQELRGLAGMGVTGVRDLIISNVVPVIRGLHAAIKTLPTLIPEGNEVTASMQEWETRMGAISSIIQNALSSITGIVDARKYLRFVATHMTEFRNAISNELVPQILAISDELNQALPDEIAGAAKFDAWAAALESISAIVDRTTEVIDKLRALRGTGVATVQDLIAHFGNLFTSLGGFNMALPAAPASAGVVEGGAAGAGGGSGVTVVLTGNEILDVNSDSVQRLANMIGEIVMRQLAARGVAA